MSDKVHTAFVINLRQRRDRWLKISNHCRLRSKTLHLKKFVALEGKPGWKYCALSHIELVKRAKTNNYPYIIVMEDDNMIKNRNFDFVFQKIINELLKRKDEWDIFNGNPSWCKLRKNQNIKYFESRLKLVNYTYGKTANFIIYNSSSYDKILSLEKIYQNVDMNSNYSNLAYDRMFCKLGLRFVTYIPYLTTQMPDYSNIDKKIVDYNGAIFRTGQLYLMNKLNIFS